MPDATIRMKYESVGLGQAKSDLDAINQRLKALTTTIIPRQEKMVEKQAERAKVGGIKYLEPGGSKEYAALQRSIYERNRLLNTQEVLENRQRVEQQHAREQAELKTAAIKRATFADKSSAKEDREAALEKQVNKDQSAAIEIDKKMYVAAEKEKIKAVQARVDAEAKAAQQKQALERTVGKAQSTAISIQQTNEVKAAKTVQATKEETAKFNMRQLKEGEAAQANYWLAEQRQRQRTKAEKEGAGDIEQGVFSGLLKMGSRRIIRQGVGMVAQQVLDSAGVGQEVGLAVGGFLYGGLALGTIATAGSVIAAYFRSVNEDSKRATAAIKAYGQELEKSSEKWAALGTSLIPTTGFGQKMAEMEKEARTSSQAALDKMAEEAIGPWHRTALGIESILSGGQATHYEQGRSAQEHSAAFSQEQAGQIRLQRNQEKAISLEETQIDNAHKLAEAQFKNQSPSLSRDRLVIEEKINYTLAKQLVNQQEQRREAEAAVKNTRAALDASMKADLEAPLGSTTPEEVAAKSNRQKELLQNVLDAKKALVDLYSIQAEERRHTQEMNTVAVSGENLKIYDQVLAEDAKRWKIKEAQKVDDARTAEKTGVAGMLGYAREKEALRLRHQAETAAYYEEKKTFAEHADLEKRQGAETTDQQAQHAETMLEKEVALKIKLATATRKFAEAEKMARDEEERRFALEAANPEDEKAHKELADATRKAEIYKDIVAQQIAITRELKVQKGEMTELDALKERYHEANPLIPITDPALIKLATDTQKRDLTAKYESPVLKLAAQVRETKEAYAAGVFGPVGSKAAKERLRHDIQVEFNSVLQKDTGRFGTMAGRWQEIQSAILRPEDANMSHEDLLVISEGIRHLNEQGIKVLG